MKRRIIPALALAGAAVFASCTKEATPTSSELVTIVFSYSLTDGTPLLTKSTETDFLFSLQSTTPLTLSLTDERGRKYTATTGQPITIPQGHYSVAYTTPKPEGAQHYNESVFFTKEPLLAIAQEIDISAQTTAIPLAARYLSSAILFDTAEVKAISMQPQTGSKLTLQYATGGGLGALFFTGSLTGGACALDITAQEGYKNATLSINTDGTGNAHCLEAGKYYFLRLMRPDATTTFSFFTLDWKAGGDLI